MFLSDKTNPPWGSFPKASDLNLHFSSEWFRKILPLCPGWSKYWKLLFKLFSYLLTVLSLYHTCSKSKSHLPISFSPSWTTVFQYPANYTPIISFEMTLFPSVFIVFALVWAFIASNLGRAPTSNSFSASSPLQVILPNWFSKKYRLNHVIPSFVTPQCLILPSTIVAQSTWYLKTSKICLQLPSTTLSLKTVLESSHSFCTPHFSIGF